MKKKLLIVGFVIVLLAAIPLTVYLLQKQQETRSRATLSTTLTASPPATAPATGQTFTVDVSIQPGTNEVSYVKLNITYDPTKLATATAGFEPNASKFPVILEGPIYTPGNIAVSLSTGADSVSVIRTDATVGKINFLALTATGGTPTTVSLNGSQVLSVASADTPSENVLQRQNSASLTITQGVAPTATPIPTGPVVTQTPNLPPVCASLSVDRPLSGTSPYSITFTASGNDPDGSVSRVTFDFGDGPFQEVTQAGGIGSNQVSVPIAHTYNNPGTFSAKAMLVDDRRLTSLDTPNCTKTIVVNPGPTGTSTSGTVVATPTPVVLSSTPIPTTPPVAVVTRGPITTTTGPGEIIVATGIGGLILSTVAVALLFIL